MRLENNHLFANPPNVAYTHQISSKDIIQDLALVESTFSIVACNFLPIYIITQNTTDTNTEKSPAQIEREKLIEALKNGEIPKVLFEKWRLVPEDTEEGERFQVECEKIAKELYALPLTKTHWLKSHDFDKDPARFILADIDEPNAWRVRYAEPPIIVITKGMFKEKEWNAHGGKQTERFISDTSEAKLIIGHEMTHLKLRRKYGEEHSVSKIEESVCYGIPMELLHNTGGNPEDALRLFDKLFKSDKGSSAKRDYWHELIDEHPLPESTISLTQDFLTKLRKDRGDLQATVEAIQYDTNSDIIHTVETSHHVSHVEYLLSNINGYENLPPEKKIQILKELLPMLQNGDTLTIRISDLSEEVLKLKPQINSHTDRSAFHDFANTALDFAQNTNTNLGFKLYHSVCRICATSLSKTPILGRLKNIEKEMQNIIDATEEKNTEEIKSVASGLCTVCDQEPLTKTKDGRNKLQELDWPQFEFPDTEKIHRKKQKVSWNLLTKIAESNKDVLRAGIIMGLGDDYRFLIHLASHEDLTFEYYGLNKEQKDDFVLVHPISNGPKEESTKIENLKISKNGFVQDAVMAFEGTKELPGVQQYIEVSCNTLSSYADNLFLNCNDEETCKKLEILSSYMFSLNQKLDDERSATLNLNFIGWKYLEKNFELFLNVNLLNLDESKENCLRLLGRLNNIAREDINKYKELLKILYSKHEKFSRNPLECNYIDSDPEITEAEGSSKSEIFIENPYLSYLLKNDYLKSNEKMELLESSFKDQTFKLLNSTESNDATKIVDFLGEVLKQNGHEDIVNISSWEELNNLFSKEKIQESVDFMYFEEQITFRQCLILLKAISLIGSADKKPTLNEITSFIRYTKPETIKQLDELKSCFRPVVSRYLYTLNKKDPALAIDEWKLLNSASLIEPEKIYKHLPEIIKNTCKLKAKDRLELFENLMGRESQERIFNPKLREEIINLWANAAKEHLGLDNESDSYLKNIKIITDRVSENVNRIDQIEMFQALGKEIQAQKNICNLFKETLSKLSSEEIKQFPLAGIISDSTLFLIRKSPEKRNATVKFLMTPLNEDNLRKFNLQMIDFLHNEAKEIGITGVTTSNLESFSEDDYDKNDPDRITVRHFNQFCQRVSTSIYENFWAAPLEGRAVVAKELIIDPIELELGLADDTFDNVICYAIPKNIEYSNEGRDLTKRYVRALSDYQQHIATAAIISASEKTLQQKPRLGEALASFAGSMGPAEGKFAQASGSHHKVPKDIRDDVNKIVKFHLAEPYRWIAMDQIEEVKEELITDYNKYLKENSLDKGNNLDEQGRVYIKRRKDLLGSGSIYVDVELEMSDGRTYVLALLRPYALERAEDGFSAMEKMIENAQKDYYATDTISDLVKRGKRKIKTETNPMLAKPKYDTACSMYNNTFVTVDEEEFEFYAPKVVASGKRFFMMEKIEGKHILELPNGDATRKKKLACLTLELNHILNLLFDDDRHGGNVKSEGNRLGHLDFTGMIVEDWQEEGTNQFARILINTIGNTSSPEEFSEKFLEEQAKIKEQGLDIHPLVIEANKALLSCGDFIDGLDGDGKDIKRALFSALCQGIHPKMKAAILDAVQEKYNNEAYTNVLRNFIETGNIPTFLPIGISQSEIITIRRRDNS